MFPYESERNGMTVKMKTQEAKEIYKIRGQTIEPVFGDIKENKGFSGFLTRGIETVRTEFNIICAARNIKRIWVHLQEKNRAIRDSFHRLLQKSQYFIKYHFAVSYT